MARSRDDSVYNARRRAKRLVQKLQREINSGGLSANAKSATRSYIDSLNEKIASSYAPKGYRKWSQAERQSFKNQTVAALNNATMDTGGRGKGSSIARQNKVFARQLNLARLGKPSTLGVDNAASFKGDSDKQQSKSLEYTRKQVEAFYQATRKIWRGVDVSQRNEAIVKGLADKGITTLEEAFNYVMNENRDVLNRIHQQVDEGTTHKVENTEEQESFNQELGDDGEQKGSPTDLKLVG